MANKKYTDVSTGTVYTDSVILVANPTTGALKRVTVAQLLAASGTEPGGGGGGATPLSTPTLTATVISSTQIDLSWTNVANESSYTLEWSPNGTSGWTQIGGTIAANTTTYSHTSLTPSTAYYYRVRAIGDGVTYSNSGYGTDNDTTSAGGYDADADAFFTHSGITNTTIRDAINAHVVELKSLGLWATKVYRIYPFVGGSSSTHACDLRNPSAPFNLSYRGTPTHTANGMECGAGDVMAMTNVIPAATMDIADLSMGIYISQDEQVSSLAKLTMGVVGANAFSLSIVARFTNDQSYYGFTDSGGNVSPANTVAPGFYSMSRTANNIGKAFKGGTQVGSTFTSTQSTLPSTYAIGIGGGTADGAGNYLSGENQVRYAYIGLGLTDTEMLDYYNSIQDLQTALSRAV